MNTVTRQLTRPLGRAGLAAAAAALVLTGCATQQPFGESTTSGSPSASGGSPSTTLVVGSQQYYSNEIIAELYAQALEAAGYTVDRQYQIGQREIYLPEVEAGTIDVMPEYSGNLLQYYDRQTKATSPDDVLAALDTVLPSGLRHLNAAQATDQDSYNVTKELADTYGLVSLADLTKVPAPVKVAANSEFATRPYGPQGMKASYGVDITVVPVEDSGGPLTVKALVDGTVQAADIYSADPSIAANNLVTLTDPKSLILPQNVVPIVSAKVDEKAAQAIDAVSAKLTPAELIGLNARSVNEQASSATIATDWLKQQGLAG
ncbi:MAG: ABC transporter substrate-binding protein [Propionicimonas sp.]|nr:ABC transporter substrate-binding protein [Propionicimonas sp.]MEA5119007.1 ABC transporter substrate-binding protein [Propionicimonas sp.]